MKIPTIDVENDDTPNSVIVDTLLELIVPSLQNSNAPAMAEIVRLAAYRLSKKDEL